MIGAFGGILISVLAVSAAILLLIFVLVPFFKGVGWAIGGIFKGVGWFFAHVFEFIFGTIGDAIRLVGGLPVFAVFGLLSVLNVAIGRWSAASHFAAAAKRECRIAGACLYRIGLRRPLKLFYLHGLLEGFEERVPQAIVDAPGRDAPTHRTGKFDGYKVVGSLKSGGSGGKLYIAEPDQRKRAAIPTIPDRVVIKSFALSDGSSLPQIVRETRALECAKQLGHVIEHHMDEHRFFYVMPYIPGDHLGTMARDLHGRSSGAGLGRRELADVMSYTGDLVATLSGYHEGGFWHKDVKPENVIVHDGRAHLVDLGLVTSLGSPMTLTTHGTEYFRDPEMVRQALRGVKVHQVNGAKFDIFAAGAVLYFLLENTFPAHGVLSKFHKKSPEALHWVVRRAMAEYNQRYATAGAMLADLRFIAEARDPFKVKPAHLPSMSGAEIPDTPIDAPEPVQTFAAGSPKPPVEPAAPKQQAAREPHATVVGFAAGIDEKGVFARAGKFDVDDKGAPFRPNRRTGRRPRLRLLNWWTGEYAVDDPGDANGVFNEMDERLADRDKSGVGLGLAWDEARVPAANRRSAKEQLRAARQRAHEIRRRAGTRRHKVHRTPAEKPGPMLVFLVIAVLVGIGLIVSGLVLQRGVTVTVSDVEGGRALSVTRDSGRTVFVIDDSSDRSDRVSRRVREQISDHFGGSHAIIQNAAIAEEMRVLLTAIEDESDPDAVERLRDLLAAHDAQGVIWHAESGGDRNDTRTIIRTADSLNASESARPVPAPHTANARLIILNDHPAMRDPAVIGAIDELRHAYRDRHGCEVVDDLEAEGAVRIKFERFRISPSDRTSEALAAVLDSYGLDGIVHVTSGPDGDTDRVQVALFDASQLPVGRVNQ